MMEYVMKIQGAEPENLLYHQITKLPCYLRNYDADGYEGNGRIEVATDLDGAKRFPTREAVVAEWMKVNPSYPNRPNDGRPNRPLSAFTIEVLGVP